MTLDPTQVTNEFLAGGADVVMSGLDTTEAIVRAGKRATPARTCGRCRSTTGVPAPRRPMHCLGVPYFNWGPSYLEIAQSVIDGNFEATLQWLGPGLDRHQQPRHQSRSAGSTGRR